MWDMFFLLWRRFVSTVIATLFKLLRLNQVLVLKALCNDTESRPIYMGNGRRKVRNSI